MEKILRDRMVEFGAKRSRGPYKESTIKMYISNCRNFQKLIEGDKLWDDLDWARDGDAVLEKLYTDMYSGKKSQTTYRNYINSLIACLQCMEYPSDVIKPYETRRDTLTADYVKKGNLTENQDKIMSEISKQDILNFLDMDALKKWKLNQMELQLYTVIAIHTQYPFRNELADMKVIRKLTFDKLSPEEKKANNWYVLRKGWTEADFYITKYKTADIYGVKAFEVVAPFRAYIHKLYKLRKISLSKSNNTHLLQWNNGSPLDRNQLSKKLAAYTEKQLGHPISTTLLAKYFGVAAKDPMNPTPEELELMKKQADIRGHSILTKLLHY
jgi:hypothetical protein